MDAIHELFLFWHVNLVVFFSSASSCVRTFLSQIFLLSLFYFLYSIFLTWLHTSVSLSSLLSSFFEFSLQYHPPCLLFSLYQYLCFLVSLFLFVFCLSTYISLSDKISFKFMLSHYRLQTLAIPSTTAELYLSIIATRSCSLFPPDFSNF